MRPALRLEPRARLAGAAGLAYVITSGVENMELLRAPGFGAPAAEIRAAYADGALAAVTLGAGALLLAAYAVFVAGPAGRRRAGLAGGFAGIVLAAAALFAGAVLAATGGDLTDGATRAAHTVAAHAPDALRPLPRPLPRRGRGRPAALARPYRARRSAVPLALAPLAALTRDDALLAAALVVFGLHALWIAAVGLAWTAGGVRRAAFLLLVLAAGLIGSALLALPEATGAYFAWALAPAPLAAWAGGVYLASAAVYAAGLRAPAQAVRPLLAGAVVLSASVLAITLAHLDAFDLGRLQAWAWLVLFAAFAAATGGLLARAPRGRGSGPALPPPRACRARTAALGLAATGVALWLDPGAFGLPALGGRFAGSWVAMLATFAGWAAVADRRAEARLPALALVALPAGALIAAARTGTAAPGHLAAIAAARRGRRGGAPRLPLQPARALERAMQRERRQDHHRDDERIGAAPLQLGHVHEVHAVERRDERRHGDDRRPAGDAAHDVALGHADHRHVGLQHGGQQVALGDHLLVDEREVVVDVAEVLGDRRADAEQLPRASPATGESSGWTAR